MFVNYKKGDKLNAFVCLPACVCGFVCVPSSACRAFEGFTLCVAGGPKTEEPHSTTESNADGRSGDRSTQKCVLAGNLSCGSFLFSSVLFSYLFLLLPYSAPRCSFCVSKIVQHIFHHIVTYDVYYGTVTTAQNVLCVAWGHQRRRHQYAFAFHRTMFFGQNKMCC